MQLEELKAESLKDLRRIASWFIPPLVAALIASSLVGIMPKWKERHRAPPNLAQLMTSPASTLKDLFVPKPRTTQEIWLEKFTAANDDKCAPFSTEWRSEADWALAGPPGPAVYKLANYGDLQEMIEAGKAAGFYFSGALVFRPAPGATGDAEFERNTYVFTRGANGEYRAESRQGSPGLTQENIESWLAELKAQGRPAPKSNAMFAAVFRCQKDRP